jgi:chlorinating enzyme
MSPSLTKEQLNRYQNDGILWPLRAFDAGTAQDYATKVATFEAEYPGRARQVLRQKSHIVLPFVNDLIREKAVLDAVETVIGPDIFVWSTSFFIKDPMDEKFVSWHQDAPDWGLKPDDTVTAWVALTASHRGNGCMRVVPGSHEKQVPHTKRPTHNNLLTMGQELEVDVKEEDAAYVELEPGEFSLHHSLMVHSSGPNTGSERRIGLAIRYLKTTARQLVEATDSATLVRGDDRFHHFEHEPVPKAAMHPEAVNYLENLLAVRQGGRYRQKTPV